MDLLIPWSNLCKCGCGAVTKRNNQWLHGHNHRNRKDHVGRVQSAEWRKNSIVARTGKEPEESPFVPGTFIRFQKDRWMGCRGSKGAVTTHAKIVWEHINGPIPEGLRVHHKNGNPALIENDHPDNLMLLTEEWNFHFMPTLAKGFGVPEEKVTEKYLQVEKLPHHMRFTAVCELLMKEKNAVRI